VNSCRKWTSFARTGSVSRPSPSNSGLAAPRLSGCFPGSAPRAPSNGFLYTARLLAVTYGVNVITKTPPFVVAYKVFGFFGSITTENDPTGSPEFNALQLTPASVRRNTRVL